MSSYLNNAKSTPPNLFSCFKIRNFELLRVFQRRICGHGLFELPSLWIILFIGLFFTSKAFTLFSIELNFIIRDQVFRISWRFQEFPWFFIHRFTVFLELLIYLNPVAGKNSFDFVKRLFVSLHQICPGFGMVQHLFVLLRKFCRVWMDKKIV